MNANNNHIIPPNWPLKLLRFIIKDEYLEEIEGDMEERYQDNLEHFSIRKARQLYIRDTLRLLRPILIKKMEGNNQLNYNGMFKNHLKIALRSFKTDKVFTAINVLGLSLGVCCNLLITLWVQDEFNHDKFHEKGDRIYRVLRHQTFEGGEVSTGFGTSYPIGDALIENIPEIIAQVRYATQGTVALEVNTQLAEARLVAADPQFFQLFTFPLKEGNDKTCLSALNNIVISAQLSKSLFPDESAIGKVISVLEGEHKIDFSVSGVMEDIPQNSSLQFEAIIPIENFLPFNTHYKSWGNSWLTTYVLLNEGSSIDEVNKKVKDLPSEIADVSWFTLFLHSFEDGYLFSKFQNGKLAGGRIDHVILFSIIAIFTLVIACFNFINLTTARSTKRSKEIGIKKVMGADKNTLLGQFMVESTLLTLGSVLLAVLFAALFLPIFNQVASKNLIINYQAPSFYLVLGGIALITVLLSGVYPAVFLSSFHAISALKGRLKKKFSTLLVGKALVVFQFGLSMILVAGAIIVYMQLSFIQEKNLGIDKEHVVYIPLDIQSSKHRKAVATEMAGHSSISMVSAANGNFIQRMGSSSDPIWEGKNPDAGRKWFSIMDVDFDLLEMMKIEMVEGRTFSQAFTTDTLNYIINENAAKVMGIDNPVGKSMKFWGEEGGQIIGVAKNFHFVSLHSPIDPIIIRCRPKGSNFLYAKIMPGQTKTALKHMMEVHEQFSTLPFTYHFLDEEIENGYRVEKRTQKLAGTFSALAILISCLGLLGLASFSAQQRTKELAIRRVLGAKTLGLINLLSKEYIKLILAGIMIGIPIAHHWGSQWLQNFTYSINIHWWVYGFPILMILLVSLLTIGRLSFKAVSANPTDSLKNE